MLIRNIAAAAALTISLSLSACAVFGIGGETGDREYNETNKSEGDAGDSAALQESPGPLVILTDTRDSEMEILYFPDGGRPEESVLITEFDENNNCGYFGDGEDPVFFSEDGEYLYYFDPNSEFAGDSPYALFRASVPELNRGRLEPEFIDNHAIPDRAETSYVMECLDGGRLLYMGIEQKDEEYVYVLSLYEQGESTPILTGKEIFVSVSSDRTLANIAVKDELEDINKYAWYRMELDDSLEPEFVCRGTLYPEDEVTRDYDYQILTDRDLILNVYEEDINSGYYSIELYKNGEWKEKFEGAFPWSSVGPFGITADRDGENISFYTISTADGNKSVGDAQEWAFFCYKDGISHEMTQIPHFQVNLPSNLVNMSSVRAAGGEVLYWMKEDKPGDCRTYKIIASDGEELLLDIEPSAFENNHQSVRSFALNLRTGGKNCRLIEGNSLESCRYLLDDKQYFIVYEYYQYLCLKLDDLAADPTAAEAAVIGTEEKYISKIVPYSENGQMILTQDGLYQWHGRELKDSALQEWLGDRVVWDVWTRARKQENNVPRIY